jgi:hypothetical protein
MTEYPPVRGRGCGLGLGAGSHGFGKHLAHELGFGAVWGYNPMCSGDTTPCRITGAT